MDVLPIQYVTTPDGYDIAYTVSGQGKPFVQMPLPFNHVQLARQRMAVLGPWLEEVERRFQLICYDSRGQGMSTRGLPEDLSPSVYLTDLESLLERLQSWPVILFAPVFSAHTAIRYALKHPQGVLALILWNGLVKNPSAPLSRRFDISEPHDWRFFLQTAARTAFGGSRDVAATTAVYEASITQQDFIRRRDALRDSSVEDEAPLLRVPTLLFATPQDTLKEDESSRRLAALIPDSRLITFELSGGGMVAPSQGELPPAIPLIERFIDEIAPRRVTDLPDGLSQREAEVLGLIAAGKSNQQIAEDLVISQNTVIRHVSNIFAKTGSTNRAQAAVYARDHGLA